METVAARTAKRRPRKKEEYFEDTEQSSSNTGKFETSNTGFSLDTRRVDESDFELVHTELETLKKSWKLKG